MFSFWLSANPKHQTGSNTSHPLNPHLRCWCIIMFTLKCLQLPSDIMDGWNQHFVSISIVVTRREILACRESNHSHPGHSFHFAMLLQLTHSIIIKFLYWHYYRSCGKAVGIVTDFGLDDREVEVQVPVGSRMFTSPHNPSWLWGQCAACVGC